MSEFMCELSQHPITGWDLIRLYAGGDGPRASRIDIAPSQGANLLAFAVGGHEYLLDLDPSSPGPKLIGTPILYPMPNRVRDARFTFEGRSFTFPPNNGPNYIHGLVRDQPWQFDEPVLGTDRVAVVGRYAMAPGSLAYDLFPIRNTLEVTFTLTPGTVRLDFRVTNDDDAQRFPFGLAIHPYFRIHGERGDVRLEIPARKWMEAENLLPTGRLVNLDEVPERDLREPRALDTVSVDDVYWGLVPELPQVIHYDRLGTRVTLVASDLFTHSVVYTPPAMPFFCVENQSCSTDAHNLHARGLQDAARLTILEPGEALTAWVEIRVAEA